MTSIGNDVVDLNETNTERAADKKFYSKFITGTELSLYEPHTMPLHHYVWLLWTVKEATYKYFSRYEPGLVFSPARICVSAINIPYLHHHEIEEGRDFGNGTLVTKVVWGGQEIYPRSFITENFIATFATIPHYRNMYWGAKHIEISNPESQSAEVRKFALQKLTKLYPGRDVRIISSEHGVPSVVGASMKPDLLPISFSHHNRYISYAFIAE